MHLQGTLLDEALATSLAAEGTLTGVYPLVALQSVGLVEAFAAGLTPEGLFARVYAQVPLQVPLYRETLVAVLAVVGPLAGVDHLVHLQAVGSVEALAALLTAKRPDIGVEPLVVPQELLQGETLPTHITGVWSLTCMEQHVCVEAALERKASATLGTVEGLLRARAVDDLVGFELQQLGERLPAVFAAQGLLVLTLLLCPTSVEPGFCDTFGSGGVSCVIWIFWLQLRVWVVVIVLARFFNAVSGIRRLLASKRFQSLLLYCNRLNTVLVRSAFPQVKYR